MVKAHINPHKLVDRLEKKYQKKTRFQKFKSITNYFRQTIFKVQDEPTKEVENDLQDMLDYEYTH